MSTILVTGANRGIGLSITRMYGEQGHTVIACCREPKGADALNQLAGNSLIKVQKLDVGNSHSVLAMAKDLEGMPIDVLLNNAGIGGPAHDNQSAYNMDFEGWAETFNVNTMAPVRVMQALNCNLKLAETPKVVTISSQLGAISLDRAFAYAYCTSKAALNKFMRMAAIPMKDDGIAVCVIHPGWVRTDMGRPEADLSPDESAAGIIEVISGLNIENTGSFWKWNGEVHPW